jgi:hypothetical protein
MKCAMLLAVLLLSPPCFADDAAAPGNSPPNGWSAGADGTYTQVESGVRCPKTVGTYTFVRLDGPSDPNILGVCNYTGGEVRVGEIRVRKFIDGVGETPLAIQNDRGLMGAAPLANAPPGAKPVMVYRVGPGPTVNGNATSQVVLTFVNGGLLVDCISLTKRDGSENMYGMTNFSTPCLSSHR